MLSTVDQTFSLLFLLASLLIITAISIRIMTATYSTKIPALEIALSIAIIFIYVWLVTAGTMSQWTTTTWFYELLSRGFLQGQTHLPIAPVPELLALPDPYDPVMNAPYRQHDMSFYQGKYYLYWGPVPGLIITALHLVAEFPVNDSFLVFGFLCGILIFSTLLIAWMKQRLFPELPRWVVIPGILLAGLCYPVPWLLSRPAIYEAAIAGGQFFLISGLYWAVTALDEERPRLWRLTGAGISWALAAGTRFNLLPAILVLIACILWFLYTRRPKSGWLNIYTGAAVGLTVPLLLGCLFLGVYNYVRFGSFLEFGVRYALGADNTLLLIQNHQLFSPANLLPNLYAYIARPPDLTATFPFLLARPGSAPGAFPAALDLPASYNMSSRISGLIWGLPFALFSIVPFVSPVLHVMRNLASSPRTFPKISLDDEGSLHTLTLLLLGGGALAGFLPLLIMIGATMRYIEDYAPILVMLSVWGFWTALRAYATRPAGRKVAATAAVILVSISIIAGILLGITGEYNLFELNNPLLLAQIRSLLSFGSNR